MFLILILCFVLGFDRLFIQTLPLWYNNIFISLYFFQYIPLPPLNTIVFSSTGGSFLSTMASSNSFSSQRENKLYDMYCIEVIRSIIMFNIMMEFTISYLNVLCFILLQETTIYYNVLYYWILYCIIV